MAEKEKKKYSEDALKDATLQGVDAGRRHVFKPLFDYINEQCDQLSLKQWKETDALRRALIDKLTRICLRALPEETSKFRAHTRTKRSGGKARK